VPDSHPDDTPVTWGRYAEAHAALTARVAALEAAAGRRKDRSWTLTLAILSGLALPTIVILIGVLVNRALNA
jgi:hypothetical protein